MTTRNDLPEAELEGQVRAAFAADASRAPMPEDLAGTAIRRGRARQRHTAAITAALSVVLLVVGVAVVQRLGPTTSSAPPAGQSPSPGKSEALLEPGESILMFRGVEVPVPASMLAAGTTGAAKRWPMPRT